MRPLKFRAWSFVERRASYEMIDMDELCFVECGTYSAKLLDILDGSDTESILMQFTGLLDSQGVEIYEDDVVRSSAHHPSVYRVIYEKCQYYAIAAFCYVELAHFEDSTGCCLEVIGNVHQHPELLK